MLSAGHARALLALADPAGQERLAQRVVAEGLSVRAVEELVTLGEGDEEGRPARRAQDEPEHRRPTSWRSELSDHFETRVRVEMGRRKGRIVIEFADAEDLERIVALIRFSVIAS